jgi:uncharacterized protein (DUF1330 family)
MKTQYAVALAVAAGIGLGAVAVQGLHAQAKPKAYVVTESEIIDQEAYKEFAPKAAEANKALGGQYLARGGKIAALEGEPPKRVTISVYDSFEQAQASRTSEVRKAFASLRAKALKTRSYIVEGLPN